MDEVVRATQTDEGSSETEPIAAPETTDRGGTRADLIADLEHLYSWATGIHRVLDHWGGTHWFRPDGAIYGPGALGFSENRGPPVTRT